MTTDELIDEAKRTTAPISIGPYGFSLLNRLLNERGACLVVTDLGPPILCHVANK